MRQNNELYGVLLKYPLLPKSLVSVLSPVVNLSRKGRLNAEQYEEFLNKNEATILQKNELIDLGSIQHSHDVESFYG